MPRNRRLKSAINSSKGSRTAASYRALLARNHRRSLLACKSRRKANNDGWKYCLVLIGISGPCILAKGLGKLLREHHGRIAGVTPPTAGDYQRIEALRQIIERRAGEQFQTTRSHHATFARR